jgi:hypothetical protein
MSKQIEAIDAMTSTMSMSEFIKASNSYFAKNVWNPAMMNALDDTWKTDPYAQQTPYQQGTLGASAQGAVTHRKRITLEVQDVENGRLVAVQGKIYIVPQDTPLIEVITLALVDAKMEE